MADSDVEKTEPASPRRLEKAKEEGQTPRSRELNTFMLLALGVAMLWLLAKSLYTALSSVVQQSMWFEPGLVKDDTLMVTTAVKSASQAFFAIIPLFGVLFIVALLSSVALGGLVFSTN